MKITPDTIRNKISEISKSLQEKEEKIGELELTVKILQGRISNDQALNG
jgi:peptidoglycan hydrolase CwlO-like protein